jgi:hypothetical protein
LDIVIIIVIAVAVVGAVIYGQIVKQQRRDALAALAGRLGLSFHEENDHDLPEHLSFLNKLDQGSNRYAYNRLSGRYQGHEVMAFDFHYKTGSGKNTRHHHISVLTLKLPRSFPELLITPEGIFSKIAQSLGYDDIDMESAEFSAAFCVRNPDKKFAYDVCHPQMMEYLLARRYLAIEFEGNALALAYDACLDVTEIEPSLRQLVEIRRLMPDYLFPKT